MGARWGTRTAAGGLVRWGEQQLGGTAHACMHVHIPDSLLIASCSNVQFLPDQVPNTFEELEALPGVGHKTASVVMAQAFG